MATIIVHTTLSFLYSVHLQCILALFCYGPRQNKSNYIFTCLKLFLPKYFFATFMAHTDHKTNFGQPIFYVTYNLYFIEATICMDIFMYLLPSSRISTMILPLAPMLVLAHVRATRNYKCMCVCLYPVNITGQMTERSLHISMGILLCCVPTAHPCFSWHSCVQEQLTHVFAFVCVYISVIFVYTDMYLFIVIPVAIFCEENLEKYCNKKGIIIIIGANMLQYQ